MRDWIVTRKIERTRESNYPARAAQTVDAIVARWIPIFAASLACFVTPARAKMDVRAYEWSPESGWITNVVNTNLKPYTPTYQEERNSYRTADRYKLDIRTYEWSTGVAWEAQSADVAVRTWIPAIDELESSEFTRARPSLDVRRYDWEASESSWIQSTQQTGPTIAQTAPAWANEDDQYDFRRTNKPEFDVRSFDWSTAEEAWIQPQVAQQSAVWTDNGSLTRNKSLLDVRSYDWSPEFGWLNGVNDAAIAKFGFETFGERTIAQKQYDVRAYDWTAPEESWIFKNLPTGPTAAQMLPAFVQAQNSYKINVRRFYTGLQDGSDRPEGGNVPAAPPPDATVPQQVAAWADNGGLTPANKARINLFQFPTMSDIFGVPAYWTLWTPQFDDGGRTKDSAAKVDVRYMEGGQPGWIFANLPQPSATVAQTTPAWAFNGNLTPARAKLDVRYYDWVEWVQGISVPPAQTLNAWTFDGDLTRAAAKLDVRTYEWLEPAWIYSQLLTPDATVPQRVPAFAFDGDLTRAAYKLDVRTYDWSPQFGWVTSVATAPLPSWTPIWAEEASSFFTAARPPLDVRRYDWNAWVQGVATPPASINQTVPAWTFKGDLTSARAKLDVRSYEWAPEQGWIRQAADAAVASWTGVFSGELASYRTVDRYRLDLRTYDWAPEFGWVLRPATTSVPSWAPIFNSELASFRTRARAILDPRQYDWVVIWEQSTTFAPVSRTPHIVGIDVYPNASAGLDVYATLAAGLDVYATPSAGLGDLTPNAGAGLDVYATPSAGTDAFATPQGGLDAFPAAGAGLDDVV